MTYIIGLIGGVIALMAAFFFKNKASNDSVQASQDVIKEKLAETDKKLAGNRDDLKAEETLRNELKANAKKEENANTNSADIIKFFNERK